MASNDSDFEWVSMDCETSTRCESYEAGTASNHQALNSPATLATRHKKKPRATSTITRKFYEKIDQCARQRINARTKPVIFTTDVDPELHYQQYLKTFPEAQRAEFECTACRRFIKLYGGLALVNDDGTLIPLFWNAKDFSDTQKNTVAALEDMVKSARVSQRYKPIRDGHKSSHVGAKTTGSFNHFYFNFPQSSQLAKEPKGFESMKAEQSADMLFRLLEDYNLNIAKQALQLLTQHKLRRADNHIGAARYFVDVLSSHIPVEECTRRHNLVYQYATIAFTGCLSQLRSGPLGFLLSLIKTDTSFSEIESQWNHLTSAERYMRPSAEPSLGSVVTAEKLFTELGLTADDMRRRFMVYDDLPQHVKLWQRMALHKSKISTDKVNIFASVLPNKPAKAAPQINSKTDAPPTQVSFVRLLSTVLPDTGRAWVHLGISHHFYFFTTSPKAESQELFQWHNFSNHTSVYTYLSARRATSFNLNPNTWNEITHIIPDPWLWDVAGLPTSLSGTNGPIPATGSPAELALLPNHWQRKSGLGYTLCIENIRDETLKGLALFPEFLKDELHGVRRVIEKYSNEGEKEYVTDSNGRRMVGQDVGGLRVGRGNGVGDLLVRTESKTGEIGVWKVACFE